MLETRPAIPRLTSLDAARSRSSDVSIRIAKLRVAQSLAGRHGVARGGHEDGQ